MDAVDELVLAEASAVATEAQRVVTIDDATGELTHRAGAGHPQVVAYADALATERALPEPASDLAAALRDADLVLLRLPKSLAALDEYAGLVARHASPGVRLVAGGRVKHMTRGMNDVLARHFGEVRASLGVRKARVLHAAAPAPRDDEWPKRQHHDDLGLTLCAHGACFGGTKVDAGTRLLLGALDDGLPPGARDAVDLGCGNGTIAAVLARAGLRVTAIDDSRAACRSTAATARANGVRVEVRRADGLSDTPGASVDLIACNPPFHLGTTKDSSPALGMIADAGRVLRTEGELWLVWNAHLPYLPALRRVGRTEIVARDPRYIVTRTMKP